MNQHGILLFAHGARDPAWARPFEAIAARMRQQAPEAQVALAYLELMQPTIDAAADTLVAQGCRTITVVPLFLGAGGHVKRDLPALIDSLKARHPSVHLTATPAIGEADSVVQALSDAALALALSSRP